MTSKKLLLIDSDNNFLANIISNSNIEGLELLRANTGKEGIATAVKNAPDVILIDINLSDKNGFSIFKKLDRNPEFENTRFIISGLDIAEKTFEDHSHLPHHADHYIHKPYSAADLHSVLKDKLHVLDEIVFSQISSATDETDNEMVSFENAANDIKTVTNSISGSTDDTLDELDSLLGDVSDTSLLSEGNDEADLSELDRMLGFEEEVEETDDQAVSTEDELVDAPDMPPLPDEEYVEDEGDFLAPPSNDEAVKVEEETTAQNQELDDEDEEFEKAFNEAIMETGLSDDTEDEPEELLDEVEDDEPLAEDIEELAEIAAVSMQEEKPKPPPIPPPIPSSVQVAAPQNAELQSELEKLKEENERLNSELLEFGENLKASDDLAQNKIGKNSELKVMTKKLKAQLLKSEAKREEVEALLESHKEEQLDLESKFEKTVKQLEDTSDNYNKLQTTYTNDKKQTHAKLTKAKETIKAMKDSFEEETNRLKTSVQQSRDDFENFSSKMDSNQDELQVQLSEFKQREAAWEAERVEFSDSITTLKDDISTLEENHHKEILDKEEAENAKREEKEKTYERLLADMNRQLESTKESTEKLENEITDLNASMADANEQRLEMEAELSVLKSNYKNIEMENSKLREINDQNQERIVKAIQKIKADSEQKAKVQKALQIALQLLNQ